MTALAIALLVISGTGLLLSALSLVGLDFGPLDVDLGDSGIGLLSLLLPGVTIGTGVAGLMLVDAQASVLPALVAGTGAMAVTAIALYPLLLALHRAGTESLPTQLVGHRVQMVDPLTSPDGLANAEAITANGSQLITVRLDPMMAEAGLDLLSGETAYLISQADEASDVWYVARFSPEVLGDGSARSLEE